MLVLFIGNKNLSSWSLRPWLVLKHAGIAFREEVLLFETPGWRSTIGAHSPSGRVPTLHDGDLRVWDSLAIAEHLAERFPEKQLWPSDPNARAIARAVSAEMHSGFGAMRREMSMDVTARGHTRTRSSECDADVARVVAIWEDCRRTYGAGGPFLFGAFSIADAMFAPVAFRFRTCEVPLSGAAKAWCETMLALPAMLEWERDAEAEVRAIRKDRPRATDKAPDPTSAQHCFAVVFSSQRTDHDHAEYEATSERMVELSAKQPGFLGIESVRDESGAGITVSYWESLEAIRAWRDMPEHKAAQEKGRARFYERYEIRVCTVERGYKFP